MALKVIDVSQHQGVIDWNAVKGNIDGAILRCGYGDNISSQDDIQWKRNADECTRLGIPFGTYIYSYANCEAQARSEAEHVLRLVEGYKLSYPIYLDLEEPGTETGAIGRANLFGDIVESAGYWCGVYANTNWWTNYLTGLDRFVKWVAQYNVECTYNGKYDIWQYTSSGRVPGISSNVDMNHCYRDYPSEITGKAVSSSKPTSPSSLSGSTLDLAVGVMQDKYGFGDARKSALGNRYDEVQSFINHIFTESAQTLAAEVKTGKYGNGEVRKAVLGSRYDEVQGVINGGSFAQYYTVKTGDTLSAIASKYGTTYKRIAELNDLSNPSLIYPGQGLRVK